MNTFVGSIDRGLERVENGVMNGLVNPIENGLSFIDHSLLKLAGGKEFKHSIEGKNGFCALTTLYNTKTRKWTGIPIFSGIAKIAYHVWIFARHTLNLAFEVPASLVGLLTVKWTKTSFCRLTSIPARLTMLYRSAFDAIIGAASAVPIAGHYLAAALHHIDSLAVGSVSLLGWRYIASCMPRGAGSLRAPKHLMPWEKRKQSTKPPETSKDSEQKIIKLHDRAWKIAEELASPTITKPQRNALSKELKKIQADMELFVDVKHPNSIKGEL